MQTPHPQFCSHFYDRCAQCWIEWKINFPIYPIFIFRVMAIVFTIYDDTSGFSSLSPIKKKTFKSDQIYRKDDQWAETNEKSILPFFFLVFEILLILYWNSEKNSSQGGYALLHPSFFYGFAPHAHHRRLRYRTLDYFVLNPPSQFFWIGFV